MIFVEQCHINGTDLEKSSVYFPSFYHWLYLEEFKEDSSAYETLKH